jgi:excisionase family DNA binding protein
MPDDYLTVEEAAAKVKVKPLTIREWLRLGKLRGVKAGRLWRIRPQDLDAFLQAPAAAQAAEGESPC